MAIFLKSLSEQLADAREAAGQSFLWAHIDTCLSSFVNDHHHRDGELLLGVFVDGNATIADVLDGLESEFHAVAYDLASERLGYDHNAAKAALARLRDENSDRLDKLFDSSLEGPPSDEEERFFDEEDNFDEEAFEAATLAYEEAQEGSECVQAWFLLTWDVPEDESSD